MVLVRVPRVANAPCVLTRGYRLSSFQDFEFVAARNIFEPKWEWRVFQDAGAGFAKK